MERECCDRSHRHLSLTKYRHFHCIASACKHFPLIFPSRNICILSSFIIADLTIKRYVFGLLPAVVLPWQALQISIRSQPCMIGFKMQRKPESRSVPLAAYFLYTDKHKQEALTICFFGAVYSKG